MIINGMAPVFLPFSITEKRREKVGDGVRQVMHY